MTFFRTFAAAATTALTLGTITQAADIVEIASGDERFSTLVAAVSAAGLVETLQGPGPFTVYAPSMMRLPPCPRARSTPCCCLKTRGS